MNWIFQKSGLINHYNPEIHQGTQPVRVIHHMLLFMFQNTHSNFIFELSEQVNNKKVDNELNLIIGEDAIISSKKNTPRITSTDRKIEIHETFLSYLWCITYSIYVLYLETIDFPRINKKDGKNTYPINEENINKARELFDYGKSLIISYSVWNKENLPNPEIYFAEKRDYIEQTNCYYTEAVKFILCHEYTHAKLHIDQLSSNLNNSHFLEFEKEADNNAIDMLLQGKFRINSHAIEIGIIIGLLSMFYFAPSTKGTKHPNSEDRLSNALERLNVEEDNHVWGIACLGLKLWAVQFNLSFDWGSNFSSYKELYYEIINQIKEKQR